MYPVSLQCLFDGVTGVIQVRSSSKFHVKAMQAPPFLFAPLALVRKSVTKKSIFRKERFVMVD